MLELCILGFLAGESLHPYELRARIGALTGHVKTVSDGALYPALKRLEEAGLVERRGEARHAGPTRRLFRLTAAGRAELLGRLEQPSLAEITDRNRFFVVLAFLHLLPQRAARDAILRRRLDFLELPGRAFFTAGGRALRAGELDSPYREGMQEIAKKTSHAERAWLRRLLAEGDGA